MNRLIALRADPSQTIEIVATGPALANLGPALFSPEFAERAGLPPDLDGFLAMPPDAIAALPVPDAVELFALAVNEGLFGSVSGTSATAQSTTRYEATSGTRVWVLDVENVPPRAFRVLLALLDGLEADHFALETVRGAGQRFDVENAGWPHAPAAGPFRVEIDDVETLENAGTLSVRVDTGRAVNDEERHLIERGFEIWTNLLLLGGYIEEPPVGGPPAGAEPGGWEDEGTWVQSFEVFRCVPAAVNPVLHFCTRIAARLPLRVVTITAL